MKDVYKLISIRDQSNITFHDNVFSVDCGFSNNDDISNFIKKVYSDIKCVEEYAKELARIKLDKLPEYEDMTDYIVTHVNMCEEGYDAVCYKLIDQGVSDTSIIRVTNEDMLLGKLKLMKACSAVK